ncbi:ABC transporter substrate-binding protein [Zooshikella ganghwensis]|uniref:Amino acid ABC transporter substrate-binding protein n=1 Tax=Zooshikella ganghwensis TaxID=202772 RepID=A0A4P9VK15_9GAMM|nr:ABC transporter substrate-binding protein [Zooshikella ganghwensis]RDH43593.1 amino acid ABC transporter substrate-binding protein [Zooshikella ganghwensis]
MMRRLMSFITKLTTQQQSTAVHNKNKSLTKKHSVLSLQAFTLLLANLINTPQSIAITDPLSNTEASRSAPKKLCLTGTSVKTSPAYGEAFINGAKLGLMQEKDNRTALEVHFFNPSPLESIKATKKMISSDCDGIIGFDSANDIIPVRDLFEKHKIPLISLYTPITTEINKPYIFSMQRPIVDNVQHILNNLNRQHTFNNILLITSIDKSRMRDYQKAFKAKLIANKQSFTDISITEINPTIENIIPLFEKEHKPDLVILLTRSSLSAKIVNYIQQNYPKHQTTYIGTVSWGSSKFQPFFDRLKDKSITAYFTRQNTYFDPDPKFQSVIDQYRLTYRKEPMVISLLAYDAARIFNRYFINKTPSSQSNPFTGINYLGVTGVEFSTEGNLTYHKLFTMKVTPGGYRLSE